MIVSGRLGKGPCESRQEEDVMKVLLCLLLLVPAAHCMQKQEREEIKRTLKFQEPGPSARLLVDNVYGSIIVVGYDGPDVQLVAVRTTKADSDRKMEEAREDVTLDINEQRDRIEVVVEAPWRSRWGGMHDRGYRYYGYTVSYDFELKVPRTTGLYLRTVNDGDIEVTDVEGEFEVGNVNGDVTMTNVAGSGKVGTVNGSLEVSFRKNPSNNCSFRTVNGKVDVTFQESLSADLVLRTFNGKAYTDFDFAPADRPKLRKEEKRGRKLFRLGDDYTVRVGEGGPQLAFDTLNGNINIKKYSK